MNFYYKVILWNFVLNCMDVNMSFGGELFLVERPKIPQVENMETWKLKGEQK